MTAADRLRRGSCDRVIDGREVSLKQFAELASG